MFHQAAHAAGDPRFWDETWNDGQLEEAIRFCDVDPLRPLFEKYAPRGARLLEGGCGRGHYVIYYSARGRHVTGVDFAAAALGRLKARTPSTQLCVGDVAALPFREACYDTYYSGGVVEHFEAGPMPALREAHRVLRPGGTLLVSVPYLSPLRRLSVLWRRDRRFVAEAHSRHEAGARFWQYAYGVREFERLLRAAGLRVQTTFPYAILFGLYDLPMVPRLLERKSSPRSPGAAVVPDEPLTPATRIPFAKRLLVLEDRSVPVLGPFVELAGRLCANMMMYVCTR